MVTLFNAISIDGFIATLDDDTSWVKDWDYFADSLKENDAVIYGRKTYDAMVEAGEFPLINIKNYVLTSHPEKYQDRQEAVFTNKTPKELIKEISELGLSDIQIAGGGKNNFSFLEENLIDEIILDIHPIALGEGIKLFDGKEHKIKLEKLYVKELENGIVQVRYKVLK